MSRADRYFDKWFNGEGADDEGLSTVLMGDTRREAESEVTPTVLMAGLGAEMAPTRRQPVVSFDPSGPFLEDPEADNTVLRSNGPATPDVPEDRVTHSSAGPLGSQVPLASGGWGIADAETMVPPVPSPGRSLASMVVPVGILLGAMAGLALGGLMVLVVVLTSL